MKKVPIAALGLLALSSFFATAAQAEMKTKDFTACTKDGETVTLNVDYDGFVKDSRIEDIIQSALDTTAHEMAADQISSNQGLDKFIENAMAVLKGKKVSKNFGIGVHNSQLPVVTQGCSVTPAP